jgi:hypothetical protein
MPVALHNFALQIESNDATARAAAIGNLIGLGIGALIVLLLNARAVA